MIAFTIMCWQSYRFVYLSPADAGDF